MAKATQAFKTGLTVMKGGNVPAYTLEFLSPTKRKRTGEYETVVIPYIEIGRSKNCNVQYGDDFLTVSRRHAAIERKGNDYFLLQLSETNPTLVNGKPIAQEWPLKTGDEIQLSMEGPQLRFNITPTGTAGMGFTQKISLVTKQAIRPYRTIILSLAIMLIAIVVVGAWYIYKQQKETDQLISQLEETEQKRFEDSIRFVEASKKNENLIANIKQENREYIKEINEIKKDIPDTIIKYIAPPSGTEIYATYQDNIYFLEVVEIFATLPGGESGYMEKKWTGSAFLCNDGKLVTARHCIQGWRYASTDDQEAYLTNFAELNGGNISVRFRATSNKDWFEFDYKDVVLDDSNDLVIEQTIEEGKRRKTTEYTYVVKYANDNFSDWAYYQTNKTSNIEYDKDLSLNLSAGEKLYILGFSLAMGGPSEGNVRPLYSESSVAQSGVSKDGIITVSDRNFESGNSGGPVFVRKNNALKCVGVISFVQFDSRKGLSTIGGVVPIGNIQ